MSREPFPSTPYVFTHVEQGQPLPSAHKDRLRLVRDNVAVDIHWYSPHKGQPKYLSITGEVGKYGRLVSWGRITQDIERTFPELRHILKWHLFSLDGPMHYIVNTVYHAGDGGKGRQRRGCAAPGSSQTLPMWECRPAVAPYRVVVAAECPPDETVTLTWAPVLHEGKERDFAAARATALWPEATDEQLSLPPDQLTALLVERLPALVAQFRADMTALGFNLED